jgi:hypothetical protein
VEQESVLSDALLRQIIAVGHVDILVGLPTLNNAATVGPIVRAVHIAFNREFQRDRTVLINSDGGSTDGTPDLVRHASVAEADTLLGSHGLRTTHRVVAPYHGLPGKQMAIRTIFAAAELTQARVVAVLDPCDVSLTPERLAERILPALREGAEFLAPRHRRHPREGTLVTQLVRPVIRTAYGVDLDEPLGAAFVCAGRFASHCLERDVWDRPVARFGIDLWLRTEAVAGGFRLGQIWQPPPAPGQSPARATLREAVHQVMVALLDTLAWHAAFWPGRQGVERLPAWGTDTGPEPAEPVWDVAALAAEARANVRDLLPLLERALGSEHAAALAAAVEADPPAFGDDLWIGCVWECLVASRRHTMTQDHLAQAFVPVYLARAASFLAETAGRPPDAVLARLDALNAAFERARPSLVERWTASL